MIADWKLPDRVTILLPGYRFIDNYMNIQKRYLRNDGMSVICGMENHDGKWWLHVSCAKPDRLPTWEDLKEVKNTFIGRYKKAIQILPNEKEYVNIHPYCLHLYNCDNDMLPDFIHEGQL